MMQGGPGGLGLLPGIWSKAQRTGEPPLGHSDHVTQERLLAPAVASGLGVGVWPFVGLRGAPCENTLDMLEWSVQEALPNLWLGRALLGSHVWLTHCH